MAAQIIQISSENLPGYLPQIQTLLNEYMLWILNKELEIFGLDARDYLHVKSIIDASKIIVEDILYKFDNFFEAGNLFCLLKIGSEVSGMGGLDKISDEIIELKRLYITPNHRKKDLGKMILNYLIQEAVKRGYKQLQLDSASYMTSAHHLYYAMGFVDIEPYPESEIMQMNNMPKSMLDSQKYMMLDLESIT